MNSPLILLSILVAATSAQFTPFSGFGSGLSPFSGAASPLSSYSAFRPFSGFSGSSSLYGAASPSMYGSASTSHPYYGAAPYGAASSGGYASGPYTTSFSSPPQYSASLGAPHTMSKDRAPSAQTSSSSIYDRLPGMGGGGLISNLSRHRRPSFFSFRRGPTTPAAQSHRQRPHRQPAAAAGGAGHFQFHPLSDPSVPTPPYPPPPYPSGPYGPAPYPPPPESYPSGPYGERDTDPHASGRDPDHETY